MSNIIDRRLNPRDKTIKNRQKFIQRARDQIKDSVKDAIKNGNIADIEKDKARVKVKGIDEPHFTTDHKTGDKKYVMPGNKEHIVGDKQAKPNEQGGPGGSEGGLGESQDDFEFVLSKDEFLDFIFEDLELPNLVKKQMKDVTKVQMKRAGYSNQGNPSQLDIVRSLKNSIGRRIGLCRPKDEEIAELEEKLLSTVDDDEKNKIIEQIEELKRRQVAIPWLDPFDVRYRNFVPQPQPMTKAVMFCIMDVSASMGEKEKDLAKRFFFLLHMFLYRKYQKVEVVFIRHHETAIECDEQEFFHSKESGGTVVSGAIELTKKIINERYNLNEWNIYVAQASDGDNYGDDYQPCNEAMISLLPLVQYFAYVELRDSNYYDGSLRRSDIWKLYEHLIEMFPTLQIKKAFRPADIWPVFKELFAKESTKQ
jgi:uncharacterized sporulation protein YeaH/YhbH (DUF444 family)